MRVDLLGMPYEVAEAVSVLREHLNVVEATEPLRAGKGAHVLVAVEIRPATGPQGWMALPTGRVPGTPVEIKQALGAHDSEPIQQGAAHRRPRRVGGGGLA